MALSASIETNRGDVISGFHESARDFCREATLVFSKDGVRLYGQDSYKIVLVQYFLPADAVRSNGQGRYECGPDRIEVGINTKIVANCVSSVACGDLVGFSVDLEDDDRLVIRCQNPTSGKRSCYRVITPEVPEDAIARNPIESYGYNSEITMSSLLFHDMLRDLTKSDSISVRVCCDGERLVMFANGKHIKAAFEVRAGDDASRFSYTKGKTDKWPVCECFSIGFLQRVAKAKGVAQSISLYLKPNFPIAFAYKTTVGTLSFMVTPRDDEEWTENPESRVMPPPSEDIDGILPRTRSNGSGKKKIKEEEEEEEEETSAKEEEEEDEEKTPDKKKRRL